MALAIRFRQTARSVHLWVQRLLGASHSRDSCDVRSTICSWQRWQVVRRDHSRCRGCDRRGDEVTLEVHPIEPEVSEIDGLLTLCPSCRALANVFQLTDANIPDFLRQLWRHLHHSAPKTRAKQVPMCTPLEMTRSQPSGERLARETSSVTPQGFKLDADGSFKLNVLPTQLPLTIQNATPRGLSLESASVLGPNDFRESSQVLPS
jgi:hypothetical protein